MGPSDDVIVLQDETYRPGDGTVVRIRILSVPESEKFEDGVKYRLHYGTTDGEVIVRYDNSHGVHERHTDEGLDGGYEFPGYQAVVDRFYDEIPIDR